MPTTCALAACALLLLVMCQAASSKSIADWVADRSWETGSRTTATTDTTAAQPTSDYDSDTVCFKEVYRCGDSGYTVTGSLSVVGKYMSYVDCCGSGSDYDKPYRHSDGLGMSLLTPELTQQSAVGNAFLDFQTIDTGSMSVGAASVSIELGSKVGACGLEGCEGLWLTSSAARVYFVRKAVSFTGSGVPTACSNFPINARRGAAATTMQKHDNSPWEEEPTDVAQSAQVHTAAANYQPDTVCVGPAYVVMAPLTVSSRDGKSKYTGGWLTYESFAFNSLDGTSALDCTVPYSSVKGLNLPVVDSVTYRIKLHKQEGEVYGVKDNGQ